MHSENFLFVRADAWTAFSTVRKADVFTELEREVILIDWWQTLIKQMTDFYCVWLHLNLSTRRFSPRLSSPLAGQMIFKWRISGPDVYLSCPPGFVFVFVLAAIFLRSWSWQVTKLCFSLAASEVGSGTGGVWSFPGLMYPKQTDLIRSECREHSWKPSWTDLPPRLTHIPHQPSIPSAFYLWNIFIRLWLAASLSFPNHHVAQLSTSCFSNHAVVFGVQWSSFFFPFCPWFLFFFFFLLPPLPSSISSCCTSQQDLSKVGSAVSM